MQSLIECLEAARQFHEAALEQTKLQARKQLASDLNSFLRQLRQYASPSEFTRAILDGASLFAGACAFFAVEGSGLLLTARKQLQLPEQLRIDGQNARAFSQAVSSKEVVVTLRTEAEVGSELASPQRSERAVIVPIENAERVAAVIFATDHVDVDGLELIAGLASAVLSRKQKQTTLAELKPASGATARSLPPWSALPEETRNLHWRAQRFARTAVSEWLLTKPEAASAGAQQNDIYLFLKKEIDAARESFRNQFMNDRSMVDYLHLELVSAAAEGDESKLGADYPGPLA